MQKPFLIVGIVWIGLLAACANKPPPKPMTMEQYKIIEEGAKQLQEERKKFNSTHQLKGEISNEALKQLVDEGYICESGYLDLARLKEGTVLIEFVRTPTIFCTQKSIQPNDLCVERHANLTVDWKDPTVPEPELRLQLLSSKVTDVAFRCLTMEAIQAEKDKMEEEKKRRPSLLHLQ